jgi:hypothetical protein
LSAIASPACPTTFAEPIPAQLTFPAATFEPLDVKIAGLAIYRSYDLERGIHYRRAMAVLDTGTMVGLYRIRFAS